METNIKLCWNLSFLLKPVLKWKNAHKFLHLNISILAKTTMLEKIHILYTKFNSTSSTKGAW